MWPQQAQTSKGTCKLNKPVIFYAQTDSLVKTLNVPISKFSYPNSKSGVLHPAGLPVLKSTPPPILGDSNVFPVARAEPRVSLPVPGSCCDVYFCFTPISAFVSKWSTRPALNCWQRTTLKCFISNSVSSSYPSVTMVQSCAEE